MSQRSIVARQAADLHRRQFEIGARSGAQWPGVTGLDIELLKSRQTSQDVGAKSRRPTRRRRHRASRCFGTEAHFFWTMREPRARARLRPRRNLLPSSWPHTSLTAQSLWGARRASRRAERRRANPSNLIRVMPAEGAEMRASELPHITADILDAPARTRAARALHHQFGRADLHRKCAARGRRDPVDDAVAGRDRRVRGARRRAAGQSRHLR